MLQAIPDWFWSTGPMYQLLAFELLDSDQRVKARPNMSDPQIAAILDLFEDNFEMAVELIAGLTRTRTRVIERMGSEAMGALVGPAR